MTEFTNDFSKEIYELTYKLNDETIDDTFRRVAKAVADVEVENKNKWEESFFDLLSDFKFVPGGRILSNAGSEISGTTLINCFVDGFIGEDVDSMNEIMDALKRQAMILKSEGGYGFNISSLRPRGSFINGISNETPGVVKILEMWDKQSEIITEGSGKISNNKNAKKKIRKGAQLVCLSDWHPDIDEFITVKQTSGKLTKFNMSVGISDRFIDAIINRKQWILEFPDYDYTGPPSDEMKLWNEKYIGFTVKELYKKLWDGNLIKWKDAGFPTKIYKTYQDANELWDLIMKSTYNRNEPGVLFLDTINNMNNLWYCEYIDATNPCGEICMPVGSSCLLGSLNLTQFINNDKNDWDFKKIKKIIPIAIRFMDDVNEIANVPLEHQKVELLNKRRLGLGRLGYASALLMMKVRYGSDKSIELIEKLEKVIVNSAYLASTQLAKEKGIFPLYNKDLYLKSKFLKILDSNTIKEIELNGMRNSHLIACPPTGNTAVIANNVSSGIEPIISMQYKRNFIIPEPPMGLDLPIVDWNNKKLLKGETSWSWITEGSDKLLSATIDNINYKFDANRGLTKEASVKDYGFDFLQKNDKLDDNKEYLVDINSLSIEDHLNVLKTIAKYTDQAISKTFNFNKDYPFEEFKKLYLNLHGLGIKGGTSYRAGTMMSVISSSDEPALIKTQAPKRPEKLKCDIHHVTAKGQEWVVLIGLMNGTGNPLTPYEVFAFKKKNINISPKITIGTLIRIKSGHYKLETEFVTFDNITELFEQDEEEALTRMTSAALRHGADVKFIVEQLNKSEGTIQSFSKAISRSLKKYIENESDAKGKCPTCGSDLIYIEGCKKCKNCSFSAC